MKPEEEVGAELALVPTGGTDTVQVDEWVTGDQLALTITPGRTTVRVTAPPGRFPGVNRGFGSFRCCTRSMR